MVEKYFSQELFLPYEKKNFLVYNEDLKKLYNMDLIRSFKMTCNFGSSLYYFDEGHILLYNYVCVM